MARTNPSEECGDLMVKGLDGPSKAGACLAFEVRDTGESGHTLDPLTYTHIQNFAFGVSVFSDIQALI